MIFFLRYLLVSVHQAHLRWCCEYIIWSVHTYATRLYVCFIYTSSARKRWRLSLLFTCRSRSCKLTQVCASAEHPKVFMSLCVWCVFYTERPVHAYIQTLKLDIIKRRNFEGNCLWSVQMVYFLKTRAIWNHLKLANSSRKKCILQTNTCWWCNTLHS